MKKFINSIEEEKNKKLYSINFLLAELKEYEQKQAATHETPTVKHTVSTQYNTQHLDTFRFYKPTSTILNPHSVQLLKEVEI